MPNRTVQLYTHQQFFTVYSIYVWHLVLKFFWIKVDFILLIIAEDQEVKNAFPVVKVAIVGKNHNYEE